MQKLGTNSDNKDETRYRQSFMFSDHFMKEYKPLSILQSGNNYFFSDKEWLDDKTFYPVFITGQMITLVVAMMLIIGYGALAFSGVVLPIALQAIINGLFVGSFVLVLGVVYAIMNDMLACRHNIEYFTNGHAHWLQGRGAVKTKNPTTNAIVWGSLASFGLALPAGIVFCITMTCAFFGGVVFPAYIMLFLAATIPLIVLLADLIGKYLAGKMAREEVFDNFKMCLSSFPNGWDLNDEINKRQLTGKNNEAARDKFLEAWMRRWLTNGMRNSVGYILLPLLGLVALVLAVVFGKLHITIPNLVLSLPLKLGLGSIPVVFLLGCLIYLAVARARFLNGGQKRFFSNKPVLYKAEAGELRKGISYIYHNIEKLKVFTKDYVANMEKTSQVDVDGEKASASSQFQQNTAVCNSLNLFSKSIEHATEPNEAMIKLVVEIKWSWPNVSLSEEDEALFHLYMAMLEKERESTDYKVFTHGG